MFVSSTSDVKNKNTWIDTIINTVTKVDVDKIEQLVEFDHTLMFKVGPGF